jgi:hypothetical protein
MPTRGHTRGLSGGRVAHANDNIRSSFTLTMFCFLFCALQSRLSGQGDRVKSIETRVTFLKVQKKISR